MKERAREKESKTERECEQDRDIKKRREKVGERERNLHALLVKVQGWIICFSDLEWFFLPCSE